MEKIKLISLLVLATAAIIFAVAFAYDVYKDHQLSEEEKIKLQLPVNEQLKLELWEKLKERQGTNINTNN